MSHSWNTTTLASEAEVLQVLIELRGKRWLCRGQSQRHNCLNPSIDRVPRQTLSRVDKLKLERQSIDIFRSTARFFADQGEQTAMINDINALMVLRHYGVPTRLLDWSLSPFIAAYFAVCDSDAMDGEIWCFDEPFYENEEKGPGPQQWITWPQTTSDGSGNGHKFNPSLTAFTVEEPPDWLACYFYEPGFHRQTAQAGAYTMTAKLGRDHAEKIEDLFVFKDSRYHLYLVPAALKLGLKKILREEHGIWRGSLFPDFAGAADTARKVFPETGANHIAPEIMQAIVVQSAGQGLSANDYLRQLLGLTIRRV